MCETLGNEISCSRRSLWIRRKLQLRIRDDILRENLLLTHIIPEWFTSKEHLVEDDSCRPDIHLRGDLRRCISILETLGREIPIRSCALGSEFEVRRVLFHDLGQSEISDLHLSIAEEDVARFQVVVNDASFLVVEVLQSLEDLGDDAFGFFLGECLDIVD